MSYENGGFAEHEAGSCHEIRAGLIFEKCDECGGLLSLRHAERDYVTAYWGRVNERHMVSVFVGALGVHLLPPRLEDLRSLLLCVQTSWTPRAWEPVVPLSAVPADSGSDQE